MNIPPHAPMAARQRLINRTAAALAAVWLVLVGLTLTPEIDDFKQFRRGAVDLLTAGNPYATRSDPAAEAQRAPGSVDEGGERGFKYTPLFAYLFQPFGMLSQRTGQLLWFCFNLLALAGLIAACIVVSGSELARRYWGVVALATVFAPPTRLSLQLGQVSILVALLLVGSYMLATKRAWLAGLLLALASIIKLYPALLGGYFLLRGPQRVAWWSLASVLALIALFLPIYGVGHYASFAEAVLLSSNHPYAAEFNISLVAFWRRLLSPSPYGLPLADAPGLATALIIASSLLVLGLCLVLRRRSNDDLSRVFDYSLWLCAMSLLSPINGTYNLVLLLLPLLATLRWLEQHPNRQVRNLLTAATLLACVPPAWSDGLPPLYQALHVGWGLLLLTPAFYGLLLYTGLLAWLLRR